MIFYEVLLLLLLLYLCAILLCFDLFSHLFCCGINNAYTYAPRDSIECLLDL